MDTIVLEIAGTIARHRDGQSSVLDANQGRLI
jgi:hypothetical protein